MNFVDDIKTIAKTESGKRVLMALLKQTGVSDVRLHHDARYDAYMLGKREVGMEILNALCSSREGLDLVYDWRLTEQVAPEASDDEFYNNFK